MITKQAPMMVACWLCEEPVDIRFSRKGLPYLICDRCGMQTFIRYRRAVELLAAKVKKDRR